MHYRPASRFDPAGLLDLRPRSGASATGTAVVLGVSTGLFLVLFEPVGINHGYGLDALWVFGYGVLTTALLLANAFVVRPVVCRLVSGGRRTDVAYRVWVPLSVSAGMVVYNGLLCGPGGWGLEAILPMVGEVALVGGLVVGGVGWMQSTRSEPQDPPGSEEGPLVETDRPVLRPESGAALEVAAEDVVYVEAAGNYVEVVLVGGERHLLRLSLKAAAEQLPPSFVQTHRSYLVNLAHMTSLEGPARRAVVRARGIERPLPVSRANVARVRGLLGRERPLVRSTRSRDERSRS